MSITVVTSFNEEGYQKYGKRFVESFIKHWPKSVKLRAYFHDFQVPPDAPKAKNVSYLNLIGLCPFILEFRQRFPTAVGLENGAYNYRKDAQKFIHKMYAIFDSAQKVHEGKLIWLDGDTFTKKKISPAFLKKTLGDEAITYLGRTAINYAETSFVAYDMGSNEALEFLADFKGLYDTGEIFGYTEWHDGYAFERLLNLHKGHGLKAKNLTPECKDLNAFGVSPLAPFMEHLKGDLKDGMKPTGPRPTTAPIKIIPKNAVADEVILKNVDENRGLIKRYVKRCIPHNRAAVVISGGPSIKDQVDKIKDVLESAYRPVVFCVKHSHNYLLDNGILPKFCVLLDPRPYDGMSTHNMKRSELIAKPNKRILYLTATMVDPFIVKYLQEREIEPLGWHAYTNTVAGIKLPDDQFFVTGGTCAAIRSVALAHTMGFRNFHLFGYDSSWAGDVDTKEKDEIGRPKYFKASGAGPTGKQRWTTGELLSQAQDLESLFKTAGNMDMDLKMYGEGLGQDLYQKYTFETREDYENWVNSLLHNVVRDKVLG